MAAIEVVIRRLIDAMQTDNATVYQSAVDILGELGTCAVPLLVEALRHEDRRVVLGAITALAAIGPDAEVAVPKLRNLTRRSDDEIVEAATIALEAIGKPIRRRRAA